MIGPLNCCCAVKKRGDGGESGKRAFLFLRFHHFVPLMGVRFRNGNRGEIFLQPRAAAARFTKMERAGFRRCCWGKCDFDGHRKKEIGVPFAAAE
jgi:hypothetical protein